jgi:hypothetical protein
VTTTAPEGELDPRRRRALDAVPIAEFDRQVANLLRKGYPEAAGLTAAQFMSHVEPLRESVIDLGGSERRVEAGRIPFAVVVKHDLVAIDTAIQLVERRDKAGFSVLDPEEIERFKPIEGVNLPAGSAYLLADIDTGKDTLNVTPDDALELIEARDRSPLTIDEGVALITHYPEAVAKNGGFSLLASRSGDRRVTALWISKGRPKLGWCWAGNPHTWLGSASCGRRAGGQM